MKFINLKNTAKNFGMVLGTLVILTSCEGEMEVVQRIDEEFSGIERIEVDAEFMDVNYEGKEGQTTVELDGILESNRSGNFRISYSQEGNSLLIELDRKNLIGSGNHRASITLIGPKELDLIVNSGSGKTVVSGIQFPKLDLNSGSGSIELFNVNSSAIYLHASSGSIEGNQLIGNLKTKISSGNVKIDQLQGNLDVESSSGSLNVKRIMGKLNVELSSGNLQMDEVSEIERLKVSSGAISGNRIGLGPKTKLISSSGKILIQTFSDLKSFNFDFEAESGQVVVGQSVSTGSLRIDNGAPATISGSVSSGRIEIKN
ncbi:DUF4097 family beta strand repeat-containing protein [Algoriphagus litoralis]|uniref:DUF4097 family beta strand repeat-containing protein n=1 Tax=Algoriphagus litoralis TaxID=2202829 RepID=UPI000DBA9BEC|nr:DUF4097 family beta strand repeat-containing protein [Algoriphagus litoralis]